MTLNQLRLMSIPLLSTLIISVIVTTPGLLTGPGAEAYGIDIVAMSATFTWFTGGIFVGGLLAYFVFDHVAIRTVLVSSHAVAILLILWMHAGAAFALVPALFFGIGVLLALASCGSVMVVTQQWRGRTRQTVMVAQDVMFNGGGVIFASLATWLVLRDYTWSTLYLAACVLMTGFIAASALSSFEPVVDDEPAAEEGVTEWNLAFILVGLSLMLFMMAKIAIFVWAPQFIIERFDVTAAVSGQFMSNVFYAAFAGALFGTWVASRVEVRYLLYAFALTSFIGVLLITLAESADVVLLLGFVYGLSVSATFNAYMAHALSLLAAPTHKNIVYLQLAAGSGSTLAPLVSSAVAAQSGSLLAPMQFCAWTLVGVLVLLTVAQVLAPRSAIAGAADPA